MKINMAWWLSGQTDINYDWCNIVHVPDSVHLWSLKRNFDNLISHGLDDSSTKGDVHFCAYAHTYGVQRTVVEPFSIS